MSDNKRQLVLEELERILASNLFSSRKLISRFLHYVVHETLDGRGSELNQYSIAVNALGRPADFAPVYNPAVRIEAGRLRNLLDKYYQTEGQNNPLFISMPKGGYQAGFRVNINLHAAGGRALPEVAQVDVSEGPRLFCHFQVLGEEKIDAMRQLYKVRGDLLLILSRFKNIRLVSSTSAKPSLSLTREVLKDVWGRYHVDFILNCDLQFDADKVEFRYMLAHVASDEIVWKRNFSLPSSCAQAELDGMYRLIAAETVSTHGGLALHYWGQYLQRLQDPISGHHQVLVYYLDFLRAVTPASFQRAVETCRHRLVHYPRDTVALVVFSRLCGYDHVLQYGIVDALEEEWTQAVRLAMKLDIGNAEAHSIFANNCYFRGDYDLSRSELEIARKANPFDISIEYLYGFGLYLVGEREAGMAAIQRVMESDFHKPDWYHAMPFVHAFNREDYQTALEQAERIQRFGYWGELGRTLACFRLGLHERARAELKLLLKHYPALSAVVGKGDTQRGINSHEALNSLWDALREVLEYFQIKY